MVNARCVNVQTIAALDRHPQRNRIAEMRILITRTSEDSTVSTEPSKTSKCTSTTVSTTVSCGPDIDNGEKNCSKREKEFIHVLIESGERKRVVLRQRETESAPEAEATSFRLKYFLFEVSDLCTMIWN